MKPTIMPALVAALALAAPGCGRDAAAPADEVRFDGVVTAVPDVDSAPDRPLDLLVDTGRKYPDDLAYVRIEAGTEIVGPGGRARPDAVDAIHVGARLRVWSTPPFNLPYPAQYVARRIEIR